MRLSSYLTPCRITDVFITSGQEGALLLRKRNDDNIFRINPSAAYIWQLCDGSTNIGQIAESIKQLYSAAIEIPEKEVSDSIAKLFSTGLLEFRKIKVKPFATIAFSDYSGELSSLHLSFIHLLGTWFDLNVVKIIEGPDIYIHFGRQSRSEIKAPLCIFVSKLGELPEGEFDFIFTSSLDARIAPEINIVLPDCHMSGEYSALSPDDWKKITDVLGEPETGSKNAPPADAKQHGSNDKIKKLTIGMATYDDFDGVYFSAMAIRMYHPEVTAETEILVIDNNPGGVCSKSLRGLEESIEGYRYVANDQLQGTAVRDFVFHEAQTDYVLCIDSHVFIEQGAIARLIAYFDAHTGCRDLLQGPLVHDNLDSIVTHFEPVWRAGMFGIWACDERGKDADSPSFEIPMQGLGLAACRKNAWLGYNRRFSGFGGEEGYIHQKFRNAGARVLCLPFLRWIHRFERPMGTRYENIWEERIRNYLIGFAEVGLDTQLILEHFKALTSEETVQRVAKQVELEKDNPFDFFDAIYCINLDSQTQHWQEVQKCFQRLGIGHRVRRFSAIETLESHHIGCTLSHRKLVEEAKARGFENILVFEDDVIFHKDALLHLRCSLQELENQRWNVFYLGGMKWMKLGKAPFKRVQGCQYLERPETMTCTHAVAYHADFYDTLLDEIPPTIETVKEWTNDKYPAIDQYLMHMDKLVVMAPVVASQLSILEDEETSMRDGFHQ